MPTLSPDTHPDAERLQLEILRRMPYLKKSAILCALNQTVKSLAIRGIQQRHPEATPEQVQRLFADLVLGEELARKVYGRPSTSE